MSSFGRALIVAAGESSRLRPLTNHKPKGLLSIGAETMLSRSVSILREFGVNDIAVVVGFEGEMIVRQLGTQGLTYIANPFFRATNNLASLWLAKEWVGNQGFLYLHSDLVYHPDFIRSVMLLGGTECISLLTDVGPTDEEGMKVRLQEGRFAESSKAIPLEEAYGEWVGIAAVPPSKETIQCLFRTAERIFAETSCNAYDTAAFSRMAQDGNEFRIIPTEGLPWIEVDDWRDLERARNLFG